jgi:hypothetical protein
MIIPFRKQKVIQALITKVYFMKFNQIHASSEMLLAIHETRAKFEWFE